MSENNALIETILQDLAKKAVAAIAAEMGVFVKLASRESLLNEIDNWLVCAAIATPEDMAQSFAHFQQRITDELADSRRAATKPDGVTSEERQLLSGLANGLGMTYEQLAKDLEPCKHEWADDGQFLQVCTLCGTQEDHDPKWRDMATAPRDGTLVRLLVEFTDHPTEDSNPAPTIGANSFDHDDSVDEWKFAGWCWTHDHFTEGKGEPIGWLPLMNDPVVRKPE
jgi:hypothetical protein